jgi:hypothetical protein
MSISKKLNEPTIEAFPKVLGSVAINGDKLKMSVRQIESSRKMKAKQTL